MNGCRQDFHAENVEVMPGSQAPNDRAELSEAHEPDLFRQL
jgi:hypothetical protein